MSLEVSETFDNLLTVARSTESLFKIARPQPNICWTERPARYLDPGETQQDYVTRNLLTSSIDGKARSVAVLNRLHRADAMLDDLDFYTIAKLFDENSNELQDSLWTYERDQDWLNRSREDRDTSWRQSVGKLNPSFKITCNEEEFKKILCLPGSAFAFLSWLDNISKFYPASLVDADDIKTTAHDLKERFCKSVEPIISGLQDYFTTRMNQTLAGFRSWSHAGTIEIKPYLLEDMGFILNNLGSF